LTCLVNIKAMHALASRLVDPREHLMKVLVLDE